ncbi:hypothetical protein CTAYLR_004320 [Chrysophaeum taylorii]|uniref:Uncharacterized protein n=1 Tax=Chrysophaeum taylorii TaxID=2483200 RepID=A0AAD7UHK3_9STRA|nr:hypothetical protein CTAYLR_004320 [Chrysophaeum taylorii]
MKQGSVVATLVIFSVVVLLLTTTTTTNQSARRRDESSEVARRLQTLDAGPEQLTLSKTIAGEAPGTSIEWIGSNVTAFRCNDVDFTGPVQVLHEEPIDDNFIELVFFSFAGNETMGFYRMDNYDTTINPFFATRGQADRVNAAGMYKDTDRNGSNYPLAAFLFNENEDASSDDEFSNEVFLCRFDAIHAECFDEKLERIGKSSIPFLGFVFENAFVYFSYFYANGIGNQDNGLSRPLFIARNVTNDSPVMDDRKYFLLRTPNTAMRCADLTGFAQDSCYDEDGNQVPCVSAAEANASDTVDAAHAFLTCLANNGVGVIVVALDAELTPYAFLWIEGVDIVGRNGITQTPQTRLVTSGQFAGEYWSRPIVQPNGKTLGSFGACYGVNSPDNETRKIGTRVFCSSNKGHGLFEIAIPIEVGYCEDYWLQIQTDADGADGSGTAPSCKRFAPICAECEAKGNKPLVGFVADSDVTTRNDGLNCDPTLFNVPRIVEATAAPSFSPGVGPKGDPIVVDDQGRRTQFWLPLGQWISVFELDNTEMFVRCFGKPGTHAQWIDAVAIKENGILTFSAEVLHGDLLGKAAAAPPAKVSKNDDRKLDFMRVFLDDDAARVDVVGTSAKSRIGSVKVTVGKHDYPILDSLGDSATVSTNAFSLRIFTMPARKYLDEFEAATYTHIDFDFITVRDKHSSSGLLADFMFGRNTLDPLLKAQYLTKPAKLADTSSDYPLDPPAVLAGKTDVLYSVVPPP